MARKKGPDRIAAAKAELAAARDRLAQVEAEEATRIGKLAIRAGLVDLGLDDAELAKEFEAIAARFRGKKPKPDHAAAAAGGAS